MPGFAVALVFVACSGDTFAPLPAQVGGSAGAAGTAGNAGSSPAGAGNAGASSTAGNGGASPTAGAAGEAGSSAKGGAAPTAGAGGASGESGASGEGGESGAGGDAAGSGGSAGAAGGPSAGSGGASGASPAGSGGSSGSGGKAGSGGASGSSGSAGGGGSVAGGAAGTSACPGTPPEVSPGAPACGDGIVSGTETCDDANETAVDGCAACKSGCAFGWKPYLNRCYRLTPNTHKYGEVYDGPGAPNENRSLARAAWDREPCAKLGVGGAHLAMIESLAEGNAVAKLLAGNFLGSAPWVAAGAPWRTDVDTKMPAFWRQSEGGFVPPALWTSNAPRSNERCAVLAADGKLDSTACFGETPKDPYPERRALCESEPVCRLGKKGSGGADGYVAPNGHCYAMIPGVKDTHVDAAARCEALGAHLATFEDAEELGDLPGADLTSAEVWVGATRQACANDAFVWTTSGQPVPTTPIFWSGSEPNGPQERCAAMLRERRLADFSCDAKYQVLCERDY